MLICLIFYIDKYHRVCSSYFVFQKKKNVFNFLFPKIFLCPKKMWQANLECRWAQAREARVLNHTASEASQLRNNVATEKRSKFFYFFLFLKFTWKIGNRLNRKKNQFSDFSVFYFSSYSHFSVIFLWRHHPNFRW